MSYPKNAAENVKVERFDMCCFSTDSGNCLKLHFLSFRNKKAIGLAKDRDPDQVQELIPELGRTCLLFFQFWTMKSVWLM